MLRAAGIILLGMLATADPARAVGAEAGRVLSCVQYHGEARPWGYGYKHVVVLESACTVAAECTVKTNVNPQPIVVDVPPKETREVVTYLSSPASAFVPTVVCKQTSSAR
jgi:hypothetical protein